MSEQSGCEGAITKICLWIGVGILVASIVLAVVVLVIGIGG